jgi:uncharacterized cupin superfamily protein
MVKAVDVNAALADLAVLQIRGPDTTEEEAAAAFATLAPFREGAIFAGSFAGESPWERHQNGDELVHILNGETTLTIIVDGNRQVLEMAAGMLTVVPRGCWHRFQAPLGVTVLTATPQPTDISWAEDPNADAPI